MIRKQQRLTWIAIRFTDDFASTPEPEYKRDTACCSSAGKEAIKECCLRDLSRAECIPTAQQRIATFPARTRCKHCGTGTHTLPPLLIVCRSSRIRSSVNVDLTKEEKVGIGRLSSPRLQLDIVGYSGRDSGDGCNSR